MAPTRSTFSVFHQLHCLVSHVIINDQVQLTVDMYRMPYEAATSLVIEPRYTAISLSTRIYQWTSKRATCGIVLTSCVSH
jgi:hypothetical protein